MQAKTYDVVIIGGGPAGLSAALILGRCVRTVLLCDAGEQRNLAAEELKSFLTRDKIAPEEFLQIARDELKRYPNVEFRNSKVSAAKKLEDGFRISLQSKEEVHGRKLLLATGLFDDVPNVPGFAELYGKSVFLCPYCDGWEQKGKRIAAYGNGDRGFDMARGLTAWSKDLTIFTDGAASFSQHQLKELKANGIKLYEEKIQKLLSEGSSLTGVLLESGTRIPVDALFFDTPSYQKSALAECLGCEMSDEGAVVCEDYQSTNVPGLYAAGNITKHVILSIVAAAEGAQAAFGINLALTRESWKTLPPEKTKESPADVGPPL